MRHRDRVAMTAADQAALLAQSHKLQLATINPDGTPHLVTMFYVMLDGQIAFWTYRSSQKARNLARDPRVTCLVEAGMSTSSCAAYRWRESPGGSRTRRGCWRSAAASPP